MTREPARASSLESGVGVFILLTLVGIAAWLLTVQSRFDPAILAPVVVKEGMASPTASLDPGADLLSAPLSEGMQPLSAAEAFGPETLSEKIDGKAELYLSAGFVHLQCQRFVRAAEPASWMEVFVYDMGDPRNAFSVFSSQRRADAIDASFTPFAYHAQNALFYTHGPYYVEIIASNESMLEDMLAYGSAFVSRTRIETSSDISETSLFPPTGLDPASITLRPTDVFGFEGLDNVFLATYTVDGAPMTAFISLRKDESEADALASSYQRFLLQHGGTDEPHSSPIAGLKLISILETFELVFVRGRYLAGVHEAEQLEPALRLATELDRALQGVSP